MAFIENEVVRDVEELDSLANMIVDLMDKEDGHNAVELIPTMKEIKDDCNELMRRLEEHKMSIAGYKRRMTRSRRVVFDKKRKIIHA